MDDPKHHDDKPAAATKTAAVGGAAHGNERSGSGGTGDGGVQKRACACAARLGLHHVSDTATLQGTRPYQEDRTDTYVSEDGFVRAWAVYDGHGGSACSQHLVDRGFLRHLVDTAFAEGHEFDDPEKVVRHVQELCEVWDRTHYHNEVFRTVGSTAVVAVLSGTTLWLVNVGDSGALVIGQCTKRVYGETGVHKPDGDDEKARIDDVGPGACSVGCRRAGGTVRMLSADGQSGLAMSRSFGDYSHKTPSPCVVARPEVQRLYLEPCFSQEGEGHGVFVALGSDGVWDACRTKASLFRAWMDPASGVRLHSVTVSADERKTSADGSQQRRESEAERRARDSVAAASASAQILAAIERGGWWCAASIDECDGGEHVPQHLADAPADNRTLTIVHLV